MKKKIECDRGLLIYKKKGETSFDVIRKLKKTFDFKKIGHGGTLDPFAEGVLILLINRATRFSQFFLNSKKIYRGKLLLGISTDTLDCDGSIIGFSTKVKVSKLHIEEIFKEFAGKITQVVPGFSAAKYKGKPLYFYSRKNIKVPEKKKNVEIFSLFLNSYCHPIIDFEVECSGGTYVRALGYDIAKRLCGAGHLISLLRKSIKKYSVINTLLLKDVLDFDELEFEKHLIPPGDILYWFDSVFISEELEKVFINGGKIKRENLGKNDFVRIFCDGKFLGIGRVDGEDIYPYIVFR